MGLSVKPSPLQYRKKKSTAIPHNIGPGSVIQRKPATKQNKVSKHCDVKARSNASTRPAALDRTASDILLEAAKRERSSTAHVAAKSGSSRPSLSRSSSVSMSKKLMQREMDMTAIARFNEAKSKKKSGVEQDLENAIANLRKPNRLNAVKDFVDAADKRVSTSNKQQGLKRKIQVDATPAGRGEKRSRYSPKATFPGSKTVDGHEEIIQSTNPWVPPSSTRSKATAMIEKTQRSMPRSKPLSERPPNVWETPTRRSNVPMDSPLGYALEKSSVNSRDEVIPSSTTKGVPYSALRPPPPAIVQRAKNDCSIHGMHRARSRLPNLTPTPPNSPPAHIESTPAMLDTWSQSIGTSETPSRLHAPHESIYEAMGWDDDCIDELS